MSRWAQATKARYDFGMARRLHRPIPCPVSSKHRGYTHALAATPSPARFEFPLLYGFFRHYAGARYASGRGSHDGRPEFSSGCDSAM